MCTQPFRQGYLVVVAKQCAPHRTIAAAASIVAVSRLSGVACCAGEQGLVLQEVVESIPFRRLSAVALAQASYGIE